jgi:hypothetical protein
MHRIWCAQHLKTKHKAEHAEDMNTFTRGRNVDSNFWYIRKVRVSAINPPSLHKSTPVEEIETYVVIRLLSPQASPPPLQQPRQLRPANDSLLLSTGWWCTIRNCSPLQSGFFYWRQSEGVIIEKMSFFQTIVEMPYGITL